MKKELLILALKLFCNYNLFDKEQKILSYDDELEKLEILATCSTDQFSDTITGLVTSKSIMEINLKGPEQVLAKTAQEINTNIYMFSNNKVRIFINGQIYN